MAIDKIVTPYEILFRFDADGKISGAHIGQLVTLKEGEEIINRYQQPVQSIAIAGQQGFDVEEISGIINTELFDHNQEILEASVQLVNANDELTAERNALLVDKTSLIARVAELEAALLAKEEVQP